MLHQYTEIADRLTDVCASCEDFWMAMVKQVKLSKEFQEVLEQREKFKKAQANSGVKYMSRLQNSKHWSNFWQPKNGKFYQYHEVVGNPVMNFTDLRATSIQPGMPIAFNDPYWVQIPTPIGDPTFEKFEPPPKEHYPEWFPFSTLH